MTNCNCCPPCLPVAGSSRSRGHDQDLTDSSVTLVNAFASGSRSALVGLSPSPVQRNTTGTFSRVPSLLNTPFKSLSTIDWVPSGLLSRDVEDEHVDEGMGGRQYLSRSPYTPLSTPSGVGGGAFPLCPCINATYGQHGPGGSGGPGSAAQRAACTNWDGLPIYTTLCGTTQESVFDTIWPSGPVNVSWGNRFYMIGLEQLYWQVIPFSDPVNPTAAEFHAWNVRVMNHLRFLLGRPSSSLDLRLCNEALWVFERHYGSYYGTPGTGGPVNNQFIPPLADQAAYYNGTPSLTRATESALFWPAYFTTNVPWWLWMSHLLVQTWSVFYTDGNAFWRQTSMPLFGYSAIINPANTSQQLVWLRYGGTGAPLCP